MLKKILVMAMLVMGTVSTVEANVTTTEICRSWYIETADKIQKVTCTNGEITTNYQMNKVSYYVIDGKLVEYRYSVQDGSLVVRKTIIE